MLEAYEAPLAHSLILANGTVEEFSCEHHWAHTKTTRLLVGALDRLVEHFDREVDHELAHAA